MKYTDLIIPQLKSAKKDFWENVFRDNGFLQINSSFFENKQLKVIVEITNDFIIYQYNENVFFRLPEINFYEVEKIKGYYKVIQYLVFLEKNHTIKNGYETPPVRRKK